MEVMSDDNLHNGDLSFSSGQLEPTALKHTWIDSFEIYCSSTRTQNDEVLDQISSPHTCLQNCSCQIQFGSWNTVWHLVLSIDHKVFIFHSSPTHAHRPSKEIDIVSAGAHTPVCVRIRSDLKKHTYTRSCVKAPPIDTKFIEGGILRQIWVEVVTARLWD